MTTVFEWVAVALADVHPGDTVRFPDITGVALFVASVHGPRGVSGALGFVFDNEPDLIYAPCADARVERWERVDNGGGS